LCFADVFTSRKFSGNQLCVVLDASGLDERAMQTIAAEIGFSETTFVTGADVDRYSMRIFTPDGELPFAGHPTLGTAFVLVSEGRVAARSIQTVAAGDIPVEVELEAGFARMRQLPPTFAPAFDDRELVASAAGLSPSDLHPALPPQVVGTGLGPMLAPVRDIDALHAAERDGRALRLLVERARCEALYLFALTDGGATARMFDPGVGIGEDPATGSAAGPLGAYLAQRGAGGMPGKILVRQGEHVGRPSELHVEVQPVASSWAVDVGGGVARVGGGWFDLP
jgi:trans-2,3-dihydro-3-hydroxyanthranilate isomerase